MDGADDDGKKSSFLAENKKHCIVCRISAYYCWRFNRVCDMIFYSYRHDLTLLILPVDVCP